MASIRLFGRGRNAAAAAASSALDAAKIAEVLDGLTTASMSTTWRCRHGAGVSIGEGAVDFAAGRSRSTVIRGKYTFEYVRSGSSAYRAAVTDVGAGAGSSARAAADVDVDDEDEDGAAVVAQEEDSEDAELEASDFDDVEGDGVEEDDDAESADGDEDDELDAEIDAEAEAEDGEVAGGDESEDDEDGAARAQPAAVVAAASGASVTSASADSPESAWEKFSEHDACGVHAYAEPAVLAAGVRAVGAVQPRETQEIDGAKLSAYSVTLKPKPADPNRLLARLARQLRDHGANTVVVTAFVDESQPEADELDGVEEPGAENGDGSRSSGEGGARIVRLRIELPHWTPADDPTADHSVSLDLFEFGEPVGVQVPEGAGRRTARSCADLALF